MKKILLFLLFIPLITFSQSDTIRAYQFSYDFDPDTVILNVGDSVYFELYGTHNAVEVDENTWIANGTTPNGGFNVQFGGTEWVVINSMQTYYYVCQSHVGAYGMKGVIIANIPGCMDTIACNYDSLATVNDPLNPCFGTFGCMDNTRCNYNSLATCDINVITGDTADCGGSFGCTDPTACNYNQVADCNDGSCIGVVGCMDPTFCEYDPAATCDPFNNQCIGLLGCMDMAFCNYDPAAACDPFNNLCLGVVGCMDPTTCNYDPLASCPGITCAGIVGCMDPIACNYDPFATCNNNLSCLNSLGCTDPLAVNYDPLANCDDTTCVASNFSTNTICEGDPTIFTNLSSDSIVIWNWDFGDGTTSTLENPPSHTYLICGDYYVTLQVWNNIGLTDTHTDTVQVLCPTTPVWIDSACESYTWSVNGIPYTESTIDTFLSTNAAGCTETNILHLTINGSSNFETRTECDSYTWPVTGVTYTTNGLQIDSSYNSFNCIHVDSLDLWIISSTMNVDTIDACDDFTWPVNNVTYTASDIDTVVGVNTVGCPDTNILNLTINYSTLDTLNVTAACDSFYWDANGETYYVGESGWYGCCGGRTTVAGCDSVTWLNLTINSSTTNIETETACGSYTWPINGQTYFASEVDTFYLTNVDGCDSINILNLTINYETTINVPPVIACDSFTWPISGLTYTTSEIDSVISTNAAGCVETYILDLTINYSTSTDTSVTACDSYDWAVDSNLFVGTETYLATGIYSFISTNNDGCQNIDSLILIVNYSSEDSTLVTACDDYTWEGQTVTSSDTLTHTYVNGNAVGCDSTHTLMIDINYSNWGLASDTSCDSYTWNGTLYTTTGSYNDTLTNVAGCDSIATLDLIIYPSTTSTWTAETCDTLTWNDSLYDASGTYTWVGDNSNGCDSIVTLYLTLHYSTESSFDTTISCPDTSYIWNGDTLTSSGTYYWAADLNMVGCDSTAILNLTINGIEYNVDSFFVCPDSTVWVGNTAYSQEGSWIVTDTSNGCTSISGVVVEWYTITPLNPMTVPNPPIVCPDSLVVIEVNPNFVNYWWNTGDTLDRIEIYPTVSTIYVVEALDSNGCESREEIQVSVSMDSIACGLTNLTDNTLTRIEVYPNPSQNVFNVNFNISQDQNVQLKVVNSLGEVVFTEYIKDYIGQYSTKIILDNHSKGIYLLQIITDKLIVNKKLILQ